MIEPLRYRRNTGANIGKLMVNITPDGWNDVRFIPGTIRLPSDCISEEQKLVNELVKLFPTIVELRKYFGKHGKQLRCEGADPTLAFTVEKEHATYNLEATGPYLEIVSYPNNKKE